MPELPEVENVAAALRAALTGRRLTALDVRFAGVLRPSAAAVRDALVGRALVAVHRRGKYISLTFRDTPGDGGATVARDADGATEAHVLVHLRMTGQFFLDPAFAPDRHTHLAFDFEGTRVWYRDIRKFGRFELVEDPRAPRALAHVGPDMLEVRFAAWLARVRARRAPIKSVLLDQGVAAGVGNIYADEALFRAGVHPLAAPVGLGEAALRRVFDQARAVMRLAIRHGGTTYLNFVDFTGRPGNFRRKLRVYQRAGEPCPRCGTAIARLVVGGRSSHFCPRCQPAPRRRATAASARAGSAAAASRGRGPRR